MTDTELLSIIRNFSVSASQLSSATSLTLEHGLSHREAIGQLLERNYAWISRFSLWELRDEALALDCVQEIMIQIAQGINKFDGRSEVKTWIFTIARRCIAKTKAKNKNHLSRFVSQSEEHDNVNQGVSPEREVLNREKYRHIQDLISRLSEQQRCAVILHYFEDLSISEVASRLGCSEGALKTHLFRARKKLGQWIDPGFNPNV